MNEVLMRVLADLILFLAYCDDDVVDPDVAVERVEAAAHQLRKLNDSDRATFGAFMKRLADSTRAADKEQRRRYATMLKHLGLDEPKRQSRRTKRGKRG
jgi:hypothetical protein